MFSITDYLGQDVLSADGVRVGRLLDLAVRPEGEAPLVTRLRLRTGRRRTATVAWDDVAEFERTLVMLRIAAPLPAGSGDPQELWVMRDVVDSQIVDIEGRRVVRAADAEFERVRDGLALVAVDVGASALLRRLGLHGLASRGRRDAIAWKDLHPASPRGHSLQLATSRSALHRFTPPQLGRLISRLPVTRAAEVIEAVDVPVAARTLRTTDPRLAGRLVGLLDPRRAAPIVTELPADDAAATLRHLPEPALGALVANVPEERAAELRRLLTYRPRTAGGLMSTDVVTASPEDDSAAIRARLAAAAPRLEGLAAVFVVDRQRHVMGCLTPRALLTGGPPVAVPELVAQAPLDEVLEVFGTHDLVAAPVVDSDRRLIGVIAVDDVLAELLIERRRRHRYPHRKRRRARR